MVSITKLYLTLPKKLLFVSVISIEKARSHRMTLGITEVMHQSIPAAPSSPAAPGLTPGHQHLFLPGMANSRGWGLFSCQIPRGRDENRRQMPCFLSTLQHFSLIAQSKSAVLNILMCDFLFQVTSSFVIALGF